MTVKSTKTNNDSEIGFKRGLAAVGAKPASPSHAQIYNRIVMLAETHGGKISEGGNEERLREIFRERLEMEKEKVRNLNQHLAQEAAAKYQSHSDKIRQRYESNPTARLADIMDAQARFSAMDKGTVNAVANEFLSGARAPRSEYEILEALKRLPKHELAKEYEKRNDFALWTEEGKQAHAEMVRFATMGDKLPFVSEDGSLITASANDVYAPPEYTPREIAQRTATV